MSIVSAEAIAARHRLASLPAALLMLAEYRGGRAASHLRAIASDLLAGGSLDDSPRMKSLPSRDRTLIAVGASRHCLQGLLNAEVATAADRFRGRHLIATALVYPMILLTLLAALLYPVTTLLTTYDIGLSWVTSQESIGKMIVGFLADHPELLIAIPTTFAATTAWTLLAPRLPGTRRVHEWLLLRLPIIGRAVRHRQRAELANLTAAQVEAGVPIESAFRTAGDLAVTSGGGAVGRAVAGRLDEAVDLASALAAAKLDDWAADLPADPSPTSLTGHLRRRAITHSVLATACTEGFLAVATPLLLAGVAAAIVGLMYLLFDPILSSMRLFNLWL